MIVLSEQFLPTSLRTGNNAPGHFVREDDTLLGHSVSIVASATPATYRSRKSHRRGTIIATLGNLGCRVLPELRTIVDVTPNAGKRGWSSSWHKMCCLLTDNRFLCCNGFLANQYVRYSDTLRELDAGRDHGRAAFQQFHKPCIFHDVKLLFSTLH